MGLFFWDILPRQSHGTRLDPANVPPTVVSRSNSVRVMPAAFARSFLAFLFKLCGDALPLLDDGTNSAVELGAVCTIISAADSDVASKGGGPVFFLYIEEALWSRFAIFQISKRLHSLCTGKVNQVLVGLSIYIFLILELCR